MFTTTVYKGSVVVSRLSWLSLESAQTEVERWNNPKLKKRGYRAEIETVEHKEEEEGRVVITGTAYNFRRELPITSSATGRPLGQYVSYR